MAVKDFKQTDDDEILIENGDFVVNYSDQQHLKDIVYSAPNWYKEFPQLGVNIQYYLSGAGIGADLTRNIQLQYTSDGYNVNSIKFTQDSNGNYNLTTDAERI